MTEGKDNMIDFDAAFRRAVTEGSSPLTREELEAHMRGAHGVVASADALSGTVALETVNESQLRFGHRRLHELGLEHRR